MSTIATWPARAENWLDDRGKGAWIAALVLAFIVFWPAGLALLAYMIWSKRLFSNGAGCARTRAAHETSVARSHGFRSSGNSAFDAYKAQMLERLEREQEEFEAFLKRLRESRDKAEFDQYMAERDRKAGGAASSEDDTERPAPGEY
ncbi:uncharacterized protein DUF2852 [Albidovulum inexpectatum]|uniref:Uncharacterized protein DUF2852 n=1 Tax=Albidovulum inexpectatum TaxID=196587 RepID=A0A2S5JK77_9RHOB|nr:DUF2852 domain-containing protein [Albidovulum inexpectatum]PPB81665.1 uncharacterized protein DUF2852 [Albidovulum inexpectatum]